MRLPTWDGSPAVPFLAVAGVVILVGLMAFGDADWPWRIGAPGEEPPPPAGYQAGGVREELESPVGGVLDRSPGAGPQSDASRLRTIARRGR